MKHLNKFNENQTEGSIQTLRDLIGEPVNSTRVGYRTITETSKGCFTNSVEFDGYRGENYLDKEAKIDWVTKIGNEFTGQVMVKVESRGRTYWSSLGYAYLIPDESLPLEFAVNNKKFKVKILSGYPGDERGCTIFNGTFICSGHDGNYLWNIDNPNEFLSNTW